jgi:hypothetical protein
MDSILEEGASLERTGEFIVKEILGDGEWHERTAEIGVRCPHTPDAYFLEVKKKYRILSTMEGGRSSWCLPPVAGGWRKARRRATGRVISVRQRDDGTWQLRLRGGLFRRTINAHNFDLLGDDRVVLPVVQPIAPDMPTTDTAKKDI